jgi:hypothetical protein
MIIHKIIDEIQIGKRLRVIKLSQIIGIVGKSCIKNVLLINPKTDKQIQKSIIHSWISKNRIS